MDEMRVNESFNTEKLSMTDSKLFLPLMANIVNFQLNTEQCLITSASKMVSSM